MGELLTRRAVLAGSALWIGAAPGSARAQSAGARFSGLRVDTAPLVARGGGFSASIVRAVMPAKLQTVFGNLVAVGARGLPILVARIDTIYLPGYGDSREGNLYALQRDTMSGAGIVLLGREAQTTTPLNVNLQPGYSGAWYLPDIDARRVDSLCYQFAYWLRREMQL